MRHGLFPLGLHRLHGIIQEKVYQDSIDLGLRMVTLNLASDELDAPDTTGYVSNYLVKRIGQSFRQ